MADEESICRGFLGIGSSAALFVHVDKTTNFGYWVPRSQIRRMTKFPITPNERQEVEFTLPDWLIDKNGMQELTKQ